MVKVLFGKISLLKLKAYIKMMPVLGAAIAAALNTDITAAHSTDITAALTCHGCTTVLLYYCHTTVLLWFIIVFCSCSRAIEN